VKQIDYLKLVATGRKSTHYTRPSDADDALTGLVGYGFVYSLLLTFATALIVSYLGIELGMDDVGKPLAATILPGIAFFASSFFIGGAPKLVRAWVIAVGSITVVTLSFLAVTAGLGVWYLYLPPFLYSLLVSLGAVK
jgi:hypothetical protein